MASCNNEHKFIFQYCTYKRRHNFHSRGKITGQFSKMKTTNECPQNRCNTLSCNHCDSYTTTNFAATHFDFWRKLVVYAIIFHNRVISKIVYTKQKTEFFSFCYFISSLYLKPDSKSSSFGQVSNRILSFIVTDNIWSCVISRKPLRSEWVHNWEHSAELTRIKASELCTSSNEMTSFLLPQIVKENTTVFSFFLTLAWCLSCRSITGELLSIVSVLFNDFRLK